MSYQNSPRIVTGGLVLCLDAGNIKSYPGTGTSWIDISKTGNNGTLTNGPTYNTGNNGNVVFDGTDDYIDLGSSLSTNFANGAITVLSFSKISSVVSKNTLLSFNGGINFFLPGNRLTTTYQLYWDSSASWKNGNTTSWTVGQWYQFGWTISGTTLTFYVNGIPDGTATVTAFSPSSVTRLGFANAGEYCTGSVSNLYVYNRALVQSEILQNYNANKARFSL